MRKIFTIIVLVFLGGLVWWWLKPAPFVMEVGHKSIKEENKVNRYSLDIEYPELSGDSRLKFINKDIQELVATTTASFVLQAKEATDWAIKSKIPGVGMENGSDLYIRYRVATGTDNIIPINFLIEEYDAGAAHPRHTVVTRNYDLKKQRIAGLPSFFKSGSKYLEAISAFSKNAITKKFETESPNLDLDWIKTGTDPKSENYETWLAEKEGLRIIFGEYQVVPYVYGMPEVLIPWKKLPLIQK